LGKTAGDNNYLISRFEADFFISQEIIPDGLLWIIFIVS